MTAFRASLVRWLKRVGAGLIVLGALVAVPLYLLATPCGVLGQNEFATCHIHAREALVALLTLVLAGEALRLVGNRLQRSAPK
jgi:hypothetical protein